MAQTLTKMDRFAAEMKGNTFEYRKIRPPKAWLEVVD